MCQFLIGMVRHEERKKCCSDAVSIPYRYGTTGLQEGNYAWRYLVSIPYRYGTTKKTSKIRKTKNGVNSL